MMFSKLVLKDGLAFEGLLTSGPPARVHEHEAAIAAIEEVRGG